MSQVLIADASLADGADFLDGVFKLVEIAVEDENADVRLAGIRSLTSLTPNGTFILFHGHD